MSHFGPVWWQRAIVLFAGEDVRVEDSEGAVGSIDFEAVIALEKAVYSQFHPWSEF